MRPVLALSGIAAVAVIALAGCGDGSVEQESVRSPMTRGVPAPGTAEGSSSLAPQPLAIEVKVAGGRAQTARESVPVPLGERVVLVTSSDIADEVHLHGYDKSVKVAPGKPARLKFTADVPGVFEAELERSGIVLVKLVVR